MILPCLAWVPVCKLPVVIFLHTVEIAAMENSKNTEELFFEAGADGGGEALYRRNDGSFFTRGSSGGMLDEDEDPHISWTREYESFSAYWEAFTGQHRHFWICLYPLFIHPDAHDFIRDALSRYASDYPEWKEYSERADTWMERINNPSGRWF
jgi:hypothetical protein